MVGVPPKDVLAHSLKQVASGLTAIDRKRQDITALLAATEASEAHVDSRIRSGEFNLPQLARALGKSLAEARAEVAAQIRAQSKGWIRRLSVDAGIEAMLTVSHGFERNKANPAAGIVTYDNQADIGRLLRTPSRSMPPRASASPSTEPWPWAG